MTASTAAAPPAPVPWSPAAVGRRLVALVVYVFRACMPASRRLILLLPCGAAVLFGLLANTINDVPDAEAAAEIASAGIFGLVLPLGTLVIGDAVLGAEVRSGTLAFTWLTPARFWELTTARWFGGWVISLFTLVPACVLAAMVGGAADQAGIMALAIATGSAAHIAMFVLIGCVTRRAAVWSLAIVFLGERLLGSVLSGIAQISPTWMARAVYTGLADGTEEFVRDGIPSGWAAVARLALITLVCLVGATFGLRRLRLAGARD